MVSSVEPRNHFREKNNSKRHVSSHRSRNSHRSPHMAGMITLMVADITTWWCLGSLRISVLRAELRGFFHKTIFLLLKKTKTLRFFGDEKIWVFNPSCKQMSFLFHVKPFHSCQGIFFKNIFSFFWCFFLKQVGLVCLIHHDLHQLRLVVYTIIYRVFITIIPGGKTGFLPSTVVLNKNDSF